MAQNQKDRKISEANSGSDSAGDLPPYDHRTPEWRDNEPELLEKFRAQCPFGFSSQYGGFWYALQPSVIRKIANNPTTFVSSRGLAVPDAPVPNTMIPINIDPPDLYTWRTLLNGLFSPQLMQAELPRLRKEALSLFDAALAKGSVDMVNDVAQPLTGKTTLGVLGLNPDDWSEYAKPFHEFAFGTVTWDEAAAGMRKMENKLREDINELSKASQTTGLFKYLNEDATFNGRRITLDEIYNVFLILLGGGLDTTQALVGSATVYLGENPDVQKQLIDHPEHLSTAIEEFLRAWPPTQHLAREAVKEVEIEGKRIAADTKVLMSLVGANYDPNEFPDPYKIDITREANRHFTFGVGPHRCIGSHLARVEITALLEALLNRAPGFKVEPSKAHLARDIGIFYGYEQVKLILPSK